MELAAVVIALASAAIGVALRKDVSVRFSRLLLLVGVIALLLGMASFALVSAGWIGVWTGMTATLASLSVAIVLLLLSVTLLSVRSSGR